MSPFTKKKINPQKPSLFNQRISRCFLEIVLLSVAGLAMVIGFLSQNYGLFTGKIPGAGTIITYCPYIVFFKIFINTLHFVARVSLGFRSIIF